MTIELGSIIPGGKTGILLLHDVGGAATDVRALATMFVRAGYTVGCPQLTGLGHSKATETGGAGKLVMEAEQALARIKERCDGVVVVGIGYSAMLALELARHRASSVQTAVLVEPKVWLHSLPVRLPADLSGRISQFWMAAAVAAVHRAIRSVREMLPQAGIFGPSAEKSSEFSEATLQGIGKLLDSVHSALPAIKQPVLVIHRQAEARKGGDAAFLLQRRLGGRVESVMLDAGSALRMQGDKDPGWLVDRIERFVSTVIDEIAAKRENEQRRRKLATG